MLTPQFNHIGKVSLTIKRRDSVTLVKGRPVQAAPTDVVIEANVQPLGYNELQSIAESDRTKETIKIYTSDYVRGKLEGAGGYDADEFVWNGVTFIIMRVHNYSMGVLNHYKAICIRKSEAQPTHI